MSKYKNFFWQNPADRLMDSKRWKLAAEFLGLTHREAQVCRQLFLGYTRNEIAANLGVKPRTARQYVERLHEKLQVSSRVGLVLRVVQIRDHLSKCP